MKTAAQGAMEMAHDQALEKVINYVNSVIIAKREVIPLSHLQLLYTNELQTTDYNNPSYRSEKLKKKLEKHAAVGPKLRFTLVEPGNGVFPFYLVYSSSITVSDAISKKYQCASSKDSLKDAALLRREAILSGLHKV